jgi:hypothetical protein
VVSGAVVIATGVTATGDREVLGIDVGDSEDGAFWTAFLKGLRARGLGGVELVISDHHLGLKQAIGAVFVGASWQRCRVHFMRNVLAKVPKASAEMVAAAIRTVFAQPDTAHARGQLDEVARMLDAQFPVVAAMLRDAGEDLLAFTSFPVPHWRKIWSTNPLERINAEIKRRTNVVGDLPQRRLHPPPGHRRAGRDPRRMGRRRTPLPQRRIHGQDRPTRRHRRGGATRHHRPTHSTTSTITTTPTYTTPRDTIFIWPRIADLEGTHHRARST